MKQNERLSRRDVLRLGVAATTASLLTGKADLLFAAPATAAPPMTPRAAIDELVAGNKRFVSGRLTANEQDLTVLRRQTEKEQEPFAAVLSCADSRVPVELIFDQTIGRIFVIRVAGNVTTPEIIGSLEYGAAVLGTAAILVLGHSNCGAVSATIQGKEVPGQISSLFAHIQPAVSQAGSDLEQATKANARLQAGLLRQSSVVIARMVKADSVRVVAGYYDLATGAVTLLD